VDTNMVAATTMTSAIECIFTILPISCYPRAASGHAAAPPGSVMNSRRLMGAPPQARAAHYHAVAEDRRCASQQTLRADVADGFKFRHCSDVRCTTALPPKAEVFHRRSCDVANVPEAAPSNRSRAAPLFDHLVGELLEMQGNLQTEGLGGPDIDQKLKLGRLLHWKFARFCPLQYLVGVNSRSTTHLDLVSCIRNEGAILKSFPRIG